MKVLAALFTTSLLLGCTYTHVKGAVDQGTFNAADCGPVDFATINAKVFNKSCVGCHKVGNAEKGILLDSYENIVSNLTSAVRQVSINKMPQGRPLNEDQKELLMAWVDQGAPRNTDAPSVQSCVQTVAPVQPPTPPVTAEGLEPNYNSIFKNVLSVKCSGCHGIDDFKNKNKTLFNTYENLLKSPQWFVPANEESKFAKDVINGDMPLFGDLLTDEEIAVVVEWIKLGLPEFKDGPPGLVPDFVTPLPQVPVTPEPLPAPAPEPTATTDPLVSLPLRCDEVVDFKQIYSEVLEPKCINCHDGFTQKSLDSYGDVKLLIGSISAKLQENKMPPKRPLDGDLRDKVLKWIENGAPESLVKPADCIK
jgi:mono/diheme cytochrome c family protein